MALVGGIAFSRVFGAKKGITVAQIATARRGTELGNSYVEMPVSRPRERAVCGVGAVLCGKGERAETRPRPSSSRHTPHGVRLSNARDKPGPARRAGARKGGGYIGTAGIVTN